MFEPINLIILLTFVGFLIRIFNIDFNSIWLDEGSTFSFSHPSKSFMDIWALTASGEFNPPLFHWIEHIMLVLFGSTEIVLRFMPCVFGTLAIPVFYYIGKEIHSEKIGLVSAFLLAISGFHVYYSQEARSYTLLMLVVSLFVLFYLRYKKEPSVLYAALMGICAAVGYWTHFWSLVVVIPFFLILFVDAILKNKKNIIPIAIGAGIAFIATLPLTSVMVFLFNNRLSTPSQWGSKDINLIVQYFSWVGYNNIITTFIFLFLIGMGFVILYKLKKNIATELFGVSLFVLLVSVAISHTIPMLPRYMITLFPIFYTVAAIAIVSLYVNYRTVACVLIACILIIGGLSLHTYYTTYTRENWKGYAGELERNTQPGDVIVVLPDYMRLALDFYYNATEDGTSEYGVYNKVEDVMKYTDPSRRTYYIFTWDISATDPELITVNWIRSNAKEIGTYYGITTYVREPTA